MRIQPMSRPAGYGRDGGRGDRLGIRGFNPKLKAAATRLETLRTPEGEPIPPNTLAAFKRDLERQ